MFGKRIAVALLATLLTTQAQAGLQEAMTTALTGMQAAETALTPIDIPAIDARKIELSTLVLPYLISPGIDLRSYDDFLFIDQVASTRAQAVYRNGPELTYDLLTGTVALIAPPMLGPADEFGARQKYSPKSISISGNGFFSDAPKLAEVQQYRRDRSPLFEDAPSFYFVSQSNYSLNTETRGLSLSLGNLWSSDLFGAEIRFPELLATGLGSEFYEPDSGFSPGMDLWPTNLLYSLSSFGPDVSIEVEYGLGSSLIREGLIRTGDNYRFLAVPTSVPEPATAMLVLMASSLLLSRRTRA